MCACLDGHRGYNCEIISFEEMCFANAELSSPSWQCSLAANRQDCNKHDGCCAWDGTTCQDSVWGSAPPAPAPNFGMSLGQAGCYTPWFCDCMVAIDATGEAQFLQFGTSPSSKFPQDPFSLAPHDCVPCHAGLGFNPTTLRPWLADGVCDELLNRAECRFDGGDCARASGQHRSRCRWSTPFLTPCPTPAATPTRPAAPQPTASGLLAHRLAAANSETMLDIHPVCCENGLCDSREGFLLPSHCSENCAYPFLKWFQECSWDDSITFPACVLKSWVAHLPPQP